MKCILSDEPFGKNLKFDEAAVYRIRVIGHIDERLSE